MMNHFLKLNKAYVKCSTLYVFYLSERFSYHQMVAGLTGVRQHFMVILSPPTNHL